MAFPQEHRFSFTVSSLPEDTFYVVSFHGIEGISRLFEFEILLISKQLDMDLGSVLHGQATLTLAAANGDTSFYGVVSACEQHQANHGFGMYKVTLTPKLWRLTLTLHNQIFLQKNIQQFLTSVLQDGGLKQGTDFEFRLTNSYPTREYVCQYNETHFDFISRWMERDGIYYFFDHNDNGKLIFTDSAISQSAIPQVQTIQYSPPSGMQATHEEEIITSLSVKQRPMPKQVMVKDWNYRTPTLDLKGEASVFEQGKGQFNYYGDHFQTLSQGKALAKVRAEEFICRQKLFFADSNVPYVRTGFTFDLENHYRQDFNQRYYITETRHEGSQRAYMMAGVSNEDVRAQNLFYRNHFTAIPNKVQFRPERTTERPYFSGVMNAHVDSETTGQYADVDEQGRYKIILPFDLSGRSEGKASAWLRMAQPYGGSNHGFHAPLHKGTEVILTCIDGDPDRPIIAAVVPNPDYPSQITSATKSMAKLTTSGNNRVHIEDKEGGQRMLFHSPSANSYVRLGAPNDPPSNEPSTGGESSTGEDKDEKEEKKGFVGAKIYTSKALKITAGSQNKIILGNSSETFLGLDMTFVFLLRSDLIIGYEMGINANFVKDFQPIQNKYFDGRTKLAEKANKEAAQATRLSAQATRWAIDIKSVSQVVTEMAEKKTKLAAEKQKLAQQYTELAETKKGLVENVERVVQENTELCEKITEMAESKGLIAESVNDIGESCIRMADAKSLTAQEGTDLCTDITRTFESINEEAAEVMRLGDIIIP